jgi:hypothetical protein
MNRLATAIVLGVASVAIADTTVTTVPLPGGTSAVGAYTLAGVYGQSTSLGAAAAQSVRLSPGYLCVERSDLARAGDINRDGLVNGVDLAIVLSAWGVCGAGACPADLDRDGLVNGVDLAIVLGNWG